jgi:hypothetical protein
MFQTTLTQRTFSFAFALLTLISIGPASAKTVLEGQVNMQNVLSTKSAPSLSRNSIKQTNDPFGQPPSEEFDAPSGAFDQQQALMPPPPPTFGLSASDNGGDFIGQQGVPTQAYAPPMQPQSIPQNMLPPMNSQVSMDPDNSQHMQLQWDLWHRRVAEAIFVRFDALAQRGFANSRPISCEASYVVTSNGKITNVRLLHTSDNILFNMMLMGVLKGMDGNPILQFPPGTRRQLVSKTGTFSRNCGVNGFKHTKDDYETINNHR